LFKKLLNLPPARRGNPETAVYFGCRNAFVQPPCQ